MNENRTRHGRATRRRLAATTGAMATLLLAGAGIATADQPEPAPTRAQAAAPEAAVPGEAPASESARSGLETFGGLEVKVVEPYEPVAIGEDWRMGLLPTGKQNYVVSPNERFAEDIESAKGYVGSDIRPDSISVGVYSESGEVQIIDGAWRLDETPREIIVSFGDNVDYAAQIVRLPGEPGWGTYYLDLRGQELPDSFTVIAKDADGDVFDTMDVEPWPAG
ncbi:MULTISPECIES: hypothetical protein [unclassified Streptomyces]|uniref:hypothetical protein n=1 Tax=unclassified Streptomyces TaxID=2593676 RepID=UPI0022B6A1E7|nr:MULTISPECIES: hypothetical protein [unclassified Streptomyces]MCZ7416360.1 hypothetical protein [Streptomyces sp. WMMC897]MCZ7433830.1 hypothetical protein [Streptomyces sp. WMMC1477]